MHERDDDDREVQRDAGIAIAIVVTLQATLAIVSLVYDWTLWGLPGWIWLLAIGPELVLLGMLTLHIRRYGADQLDRRRRLALTLVVLIAVVNVVTLLVLIGSLLSSQERNGAELLFKAVTIWSTNVVAFGLLFWEVDAGGPVGRQQADDRHHDFQFPQMDNPRLAPADWHPRLVDYVYLSFTNSIAFSPTDVMPLTPRAKLLMLGESAISAVTVLLALARAVNILQ